MTSARPNSTGLILHQQAADSVHDLKTTLDDLAKAVPAAAPPSSQQQQSNNNNNINQQDGADPQQQQPNSSVAVLTKQNENNASSSLGVNEQILRYESNRDAVLRLRKKLLIEFRQKLIQPLAQSTQMSFGKLDHAALERFLANPKCELFASTPLLEVHKLTLELLAVDSDMKDELDSDSPMTMDSLANAAPNSRGKNDLSSLIPVAWCIRVSYVEAVKIEMYLSSTTVTLLADDSVSEKLGKLTCWKSVSELGKFPKNVMEYVVDQLQNY